MTVVREKKKTVCEKPKQRNETRLLLILYVSQLSTFDDEHIKMIFLSFLFSFKAIYHVRRTCTSELRINHFMVDHGESCYVVFDIAVSKLQI